MHFQTRLRFQHMPMQHGLTGLSPSRFGDLEQIISIPVVKLIPPRVFLETITLLWLRSPTLVDL